MSGISKHLLALMMAVACGLTGCNVVGFFGQAVGGSDNPPMVNVTREYDGLAGQSVAVLVDVDHSVLFEYPQAGYELSAAVSDQIAGNVANVKVIDARQVVDFQRRNIYWPTLRYSKLAERLKVNRLVLIEVIEYRTHEPGNINLYRGVVSATMSVIEADGSQPDDRAYQTTLTASYPPGNNLGVPDADPLTIRKGMIDLFAIQAGWKFYDHKEQRE